MLLARHLRKHPAEIRFAYSYYGKPSLSRDRGSEGIEFNVSHSGKYAIFALCRNRQVGIDIERIRPEFGTERIAERFFSPTEVSALRRLAPELRVEAFFNCWTRKEAFIKAAGVGLSCPLDGFDVSLAPGEPARLLNIRDYRDDGLSWSIQDVEAGEGYKAAVVAEGSDWDVKCYSTPMEAIL